MAASLSEMVQYAKAQQPKNGLASMAENFLAGAGSGYETGHKEAIANKQKEFENYIKIIDASNKMMGIEKMRAETDSIKAQTEESKSILGFIKQEQAQDEADARIGALEAVGQESNKPKPNTRTGKAMELMSTELETSGGKVKGSMKFGQSNRMTPDQYRAYVKGTDEDVIKAWDGDIPEWVTKGRETRELRKQLVNSRVNEYKIGKDIMNYAVKMDNDPVIKEAKKQGISLGQVDNIVEMVRGGNTIAGNALGAKMAKGMGEVGVLTESDVRRYVESGQLSRKAGDRVSKWLTGVPSEATLDEIQEIAGILKNGFEEKVQPIYNTYAERIANNSSGHITPDEAAFRMGVEYRPKAKPSTTKSATAPKKIGRFEVSVEP